MRPRATFLLKFALLIVVLYLAVALRPVDRHVVTPFSEAITAASAWVLNGVGEPVVREGTMIRSPRFAVDVKNGCNGLEAVLLLVAAVLAFPASWKAKLIGVVGGTLAIEALNLVRVTSLYVLGRDYPHLFETFHVTVWQAVIFVLTIAMFLVWSARVAPPQSPASA
ncbi:MAG TPA: exosortase H [Thermoanaerobaculia bacterium]|nr:exosortase H [Thermoanaerobaculia bacterium]